LETNLVFINVLNFGGCKLVTKQAFAHSTFPLLDFFGHVIQA